MAETPTYSYADIQRYLQHKMSSQEMHEFEKALMNDPFLADALEGFSAGNDLLAKQHLADIEKAITGEQKEARVIPLVTQKTPWWKVAAIIFIIVSAGGITYAILNNSGVVSHDREIASIKPNMANIEKDSIRPPEKLVATVNTALRNHALTNQKTRSDRNPHTDLLIKTSKAELADKYEDKKETTESLTTSSANLIVPKANDLLRSSQQLQLRSSTIENESREKLTDKNKPLENGTITANNKISTSGAGENFLLKAGDSATKLAKNTSNASDNKAELKEEKLSLSEIVVTEMRNRNKNLGMTIRVDSSNSAEPIGGLKNYQEYLGKQRDFIRELESFRNADDRVVVEFSTNEQGQPVSIEVPQEMDKITAKKTIEIISKGPVWKNKQKEKKVKVIIEF